MILQNLIDTYEELKKRVYICKKGDKKSILIQFSDENFFHLVGLHKTNMNLFIPQYITSKSKKYKYIKKNVKKFNNILLSEIKGDTSLKYRVTSFNQISDLLKGYNTTLYDLHPKIAGSLYDGDFGLLKIYETINCLLGLVIYDFNDSVIKCAPQSWMASDRINHLIEFRRPIYMEEIIAIPIEMFEDTVDFVLS